MIKALFTTRWEQTAEAMRGIMTPQIESPDDLAVFGDSVRQYANSGNTVVDAVDETLDAARFSNNRAVRDLAKDVRTTFKSWQPVTEQTTSYVDLGGTRLDLFNALDVLSMGMRLLWLADLQQERADWLTDYQSFATGDAALDGDQSLAANTATAEARDNWTQRSIIILQFVRDNARDLALRATAEVLAKKWVDWSWKTYGKRTTGHLVAGAASSVLLGFTIGNLLYGLDDLFDNFKAGERADELRHRFRAGRNHLKIEAAQRTGGPYDGDLADRYRTVYMLESLAAAQMYRSYADGVEATVRGGLLSLVNPISWFNGKEWREAAQEIREIASQVERDAETQVGHPQFVQAAVVLVSSRVAVTPEPDSEPEPTTLLPAVSEAAQNLQQWISEKLQEWQAGAEAWWATFRQEQIDRLQREAERLLSGWQAKAEAWWTQFWAEQSQKLIREAERQFNELVQQLCGGPTTLLLAGVAVAYRRRRR